MVVPMHKTSFSFTQKKKCHISIWRTKNVEEKIYRIQLLHKTGDKSTVMFSKFIESFRN